MRPCRPLRLSASRRLTRSEEHTSELQSHSDLVCRLLLEKKNTLSAGPSYASRTPARRPWRDRKPPPVPIARRRPRRRVSSARPAPAGGRFCFNDTASTEIYTLSLHDALPI